MEEKVLSLDKFSAVASGGLESLAPPFWFTKKKLFGTSCNDKKTDNDAKRNNDIQAYVVD